MAHPAMEGKAHKKHRHEAKHEDHASVDAPFWFISWADLVTLLFGLFVALFSISTMSEEKLKAFLAGIRAHFSQEEGTDALTAMSKKLKWKNPRQGDYFKRGDDKSRFPGPSPEETTVRGIAESQQDLRRIGSRLVSGGRIDFERGSTHLSEKAIDNLKQVSTALRGHRNRVEVRGFATGAELDSKRLADAWDLAFARAKAVSDYLTDPERGGLLPHQIRMVVGGPAEPISFESGPNQRVEIIHTAEFIHFPWQSSHPLHQQWVKEKQRGSAHIVYTLEAVKNLQQVKQGNSATEVRKLLGEPEEFRREPFEEKIYEEWRYRGGTIRFYVYESGEIGPVVAVGARQSWGFTISSGGR